MKAILLTGLSGLAIKGGDVGQLLAGRLGGLPRTAVEGRVDRRAHGLSLAAGEPGPAARLSG